MLTTQNTERSLVSTLLEQLRETLRALPDVQELQTEHEAPAAADRPARYDARIDLRVADKPLVLLIAAKKLIYPRDARQALWQLQALNFPATQNQGAEQLPLLIAESISPGAKEFLQRERVGYYDSGGSLFLPAKGAYLYVDKPPPKPMARAIQSLYSGRRAQVLHALLNQHDAWVGVKALAAEAHVSPTTASQVLTALDRLDWLESQGQGPTKKRHLREPAALLDAWSRQIATERPPALRRFYVPTLRGDALADRVGEVLGYKEAEYALTHEAAAQRYAPFLSSVLHVRCRVIPGRAADEALSILRAQPVTEGANLSLIDAKPPGELLFRQKVGEVWLASPIQVYLDLLRGEGRAKEMAAHLRRERIGF